MALITINTTFEERQAVYNAIRGLVGVSVAVTEIARRSKLKDSRARYALEDLITAGRIIKKPTRAINKRYIRYAYYIVEPTTV